MKSKGLKKIMKTKRIKTNTPLYCVQGDISSRVVLFLLGTVFLLLGVFWLISSLNQVQLKPAGIFYMVGCNLFFILGGLFLLQKAFLRVRVYPDETFKIRWFFLEKSYRMSDVRTVVIKSEFVNGGYTKVYKFYTHTFFPICTTTWRMKNVERLYNATVAYGAKTQKK